MHSWLDFQGETLSLELWTKTIEDELEIEVYHENLLLGVTEMVLRTLSFDGSDVSLEVPSDFYEERIQLMVGLDYVPFHPGADVYHLYRQTCLQLVDAVLTIGIAQGTIATTVLSDARARYKRNVWHYLESVSAMTSLDLQLDCKQPGKKPVQSFKSTLDLNSGNKTDPHFLEIGPEDRKVTLYISPSLSIFQSSPSNTLRLSLPKSNTFLKDSDFSSLSISVKSPLIAEESDNEKTFQKSDFEEAYENEDLEEYVSLELVTMTAEDKLVVTMHGMQGGTRSIKAIGLVRLVEIPSLQYQIWSKCLLQCGEEVMDVRVMLQKEDPQATRSKAGSMATAAAMGSGKPRVFYDILDMMDYKLGRIRQKNSLLNVQIGKLRKTRENQKRQLFELEHAPARAEFKSILQRSHKRQADSKPAKAGEEMSICMCGAINPKFKGYCEKCVTKLKADYEKVRKWFEPTNKIFTDYERRLKSWNTRKAALEYKLTRLEEKLQLPFVVEQSEDSKQVNDLMEEFAKLQVDKELLEQDSNAHFEKLDAEEEAALGIIQQTDEEIATAASEFEEVQHRNESISKDIEDTQGKVQEAQQFYEKHVRKIGRKQ